ncbi:MAG: MBL fold metallo-hydrolase [Archaeoglobi archaeon]|nr:MBL fold metallo-hydrolase [Candidatus Mnemosynella sp.]MBC7114837.1 MBL fold metallo-hydrolase [Candidatus Mnemosynella bozhongmuii]
MSEFEILLRGELLRDGERILYASSTVTFIDDGIFVIVDTGSEDKRDELREKMREVGISENEIDVVFNTHAHRDHTGNNEIFRNARILAPEGEHRDIARAEISPERISENLRVLRTPGHTWNHASLMMDERVCCAGDAIPTADNLREWVPPRINVSRELALESMRVIVESSELIIPGHDEMVKRDMVNKWLKS